MFDVVHCLNLFDLHDCIGYLTTNFNILHAIISAIRSRLLLRILNYPFISKTHVEKVY